MPILPASPQAWQQALMHLKLGELVVFPTDTVYGVGCDPLNVQAINAIYDAKGRERQKAIPLLLSGADQLGAVATELPGAATLLASRFWPGALTLVVPQSAHLPEELGGGDTIAVRVPDYAELRDFIAACGGLIAATSANVSGQQDAVSAQQAADYLGAHVGIIIDGGETPGNVPSTVVDCTTDPPRILRAGALDPALLWQALGLE
ncbi:MAG TPA: L-threonylcarbamoyladenylate synthase [Chloroflexia bacterium]|nr:L-threonylcarbamoyladenylate synthase [Chloroflexia bacterium]